MGPRECMLVGRPHVGKTLFLLQFAAYCGVQSFRLAVCMPEGAETDEHWKLQEARDVLVGGWPHRTLRLQSLELELPKGKGKKTLVLTDTTGLNDTVHETEEVRRAAAQTLRSLRKASMILQVIDAARTGIASSTRALTEIDLQVARYAALRCPFAILANKMDLPGSEEGLRRIQRALPTERVFPISALHRYGFREVKKFVRDSL